MFGFVALCHANSTLARPDKESLSEQLLMELLIAKIRSPEVFLDTSGSVRDIHTWEGLAFDAFQRVIGIRWDESTGIRHVERGCNPYSGNVLALSGDIDMQWIPWHVQYFMLLYLDVGGSVETHHLPRCLESLNMGGNCFQGTFHIDTLPLNMADIHIEGNRLSGSLNLAKMSPNMRTFCAMWNFFSGSLDLSRLPDTVEVLRLELNEFCGELYLHSFPTNIRHISLYHNAFTQENLVIGSIPEHLRSLQIDASMGAHFIYPDGYDKRSNIIEFVESM